MTWSTNKRVSEYRARAAELRVKAETISDPEAREVLLQDAQQWDRMADYEEKNPTRLD